MDDIKLTKEELFILKLCDEEPGSIENLQANLKNKFSKKILEKILDKLLEKKLVYFDKGIWASTLKGSKFLEVSS